MKKSLLVVCFLWSLMAYGQNLEIGINSGTGSAYFVEAITKTSDYRYNMPISMAGELKFTPKGKTWGMKLRVNQIGVGMRMKDLPYTYRSEDFANSLTTAFLFEKNIVKNNFSYGFNFGAGITSETLEVDFCQRKEKFASIMFGGHITFKISETFDFQILPIVLWLDPARSIAFLNGSTFARIAAEDAIATLNIGLRYKIF